MAPPLSPSSIQALSRLRAYASPGSIALYSSLPVSRRAAVLILLFADQAGDLRVVLTLRADTLRQVALPGGKPTSAAESASTTALREAHEEIGLPLSPSPPEPLCHFPGHLSRSYLCVLPCLAFLPSPPAAYTPNPQEVSSIFSWPLRAFLSKSPLPDTPDTPPWKWYEGSWIQWYGEEWRMHHFYVPAAGNGDGVDGKGGGGYYKVWGMTARILVDAARVAYAREPEFEHSQKFGDETLMEKLVREGKMGEMVRSSLGGDAEVKEGEDEEEHRSSAGAKI
ncbi:hypothetical protein FGG08_001350 [Glutinoglossum americanum]|uniref:Nudix hydrolase domain-containing protein n=1 Tax=Glutinoglossum americanum TaxID=1670608 RepID=A0A9P8L099_9PEZI|nr:hypothetical protein FGG08_001350 [Glutinoglossum americanum]